MDSNFQVKMVGYQDKKWKSEIGRVVRRQLNRSPFGDWMTLIARVLSIILCTVSFAFTALLGLGQLLSQDEFPDPLEKTILTVLFIFSLCLLLVCLGIRKRPDPLRVNLWPIGALVVTAAFALDAFQVDETYFTSRVDYRAVQAIFETNTAFYLFVHDELVLMLRKREFIQGDPEQFRSFIQQRTGKPVIYVR